MHALTRTEAMPRYKAVWSVGNTAQRLRHSLAHNSSIALSVRPALSALGPRRPRHAGGAAVAREMPGEVMPHSRTTILRVSLSEPTSSRQR